MSSSFLGWRFVISTFASHIAQIIKNVSYPTSHVPKGVLNRLPEAGPAGCGPAAAAGAGAGAAGGGPPGAGAGAAAGAGAGDTGANWILGGNAITILGLLNTS